MRNHKQPSAYQRRRKQKRKPRPKKRLFYIPAGLFALAMILFLRPYLFPEEAENLSSAESTTVQAQQNRKETVSLRGDIQKIDQELRDIHFSGTAYILEQGELLLEKGYGYANFAAKEKNGPETVFLIASCQKAFTAHLIMQQVAKGNMRLDDPLSLYYPALIHSDTITIRDLLDMTSGLYMKDLPGETLSGAEYLAYIQSHVIYEKRETWRYSIVNYLILASILEQVTGESYETLFRQTFITDLQLQESGINHDFFAQKHAAISYRTLEKKATLGPYTPISFAPYQLARELGTGSAYMSCRDVAASYQQILTDGYNQIALYQKDEDQVYVAGLYQKDYGYFAHGVLFNQEMSIATSEDGRTLIILASNQRPADKSLYSRIAEENLRDLMNTTRADKQNEATHYEDEE